MLVYELILEIEWILSLGLLFSHQISERIITRGTSYLIAPLFECIRIRHPIPNLVCLNLEQVLLVERVIVVWHLKLVLLEHHFKGVSLPR